MLRTILMVLFFIVCVALCIVVLVQKGRDSGIGGLTGGSSDTYWSKNKARSREGMMIMITRVLTIAALLLACALNVQLPG